MTKSNILIRTNTFINPNIRLTSSKPEKLVKRSISGVGGLGSFLLATKHDFRSKKNNQNSNSNNNNATSDEVIIMKEFKPNKIKKNDTHPETTKIRYKNVSPNSDQSEFSSSSISSSLNSAIHTNKANEENRPQINRHNTELYIRSNFDNKPIKREDTAKNEKNRIQVDLYRSSPTLFYIKEKYKMYLDWLNENGGNKEINSLHSKPSTSDNQMPIQLNWYNYEKIVYLNEASGLDYLKYIQNDNISNQVPVSVVASNTEVNHKKEAVQQLTRNVSSSLSFNKLKSNSKNKTRASSQQDIISSNRINDPLIKNLSTNKPSESIIISNLNNNNAKTNTSLNLKNILNKISNTNDIFETSCNGQTIESKLAKGVKFDQSMNCSQQAIVNSFSAVINPTHNLKPILKSSTNNNHTNENYINLNSCSQSQPNNIRRVSLISLNTNMKTDKSSNSNMIACSKNFSNLKLPPIVNCSEDFYAVLHDLEKDNLIL